MTEYRGNDQDKSINGKLLMVTPINAKDGDDTVFGMAGK